MAKQERNYDLNYLKEISGGDESFVFEMVEYFVLNTPETINQLNQFFLNGEFENLSSNAHKFSSNVSFLGAHQLDELLEQIHLNILKNVKMEEIPQMLKVIEENCKVIVMELKEDFNL